MNNDLFTNYGAQKETDSIQLCPVKRASRKH